MQGIVSLLDPIHNQLIEELWKELEEDCGVAGVHITPIPHFSWHVAQDYHLDLLRPILLDIARTSQTFVVKTNGIGMFTGLRPVVFIPLVKDASLLHFHEYVWERIQAAAVSPSPYYTPTGWIPHITIAHGDTDWDKLTCALEKLVFEPFTWDLKVDNISLISQFDGRAGEESLHYIFGQDGVSPPPGT